MPRIPQLSTDLGEHPIAEREGIDLELGETTARQLRVTFLGLSVGAPLGHRISVYSLEIYQYRRP